MSERLKKGECSDIKREIITDDHGYNNVMEFQTDKNRNIELDGVLVTQPPKESVDVIPRYSLGCSYLKGILNKRC